VLAEYKKAAQVTRDRLYTETLQEVYSNVTKVLVDSRQGSNLLYLPLDKILHSSGAAPQAAQDAARTPAQNGVTVVPATPIDARVRDVNRSRERESR
jgi:membrane protease subunit HflK